MSSSSQHIQPRFKHKTLFINEDGSETYIGDFRTFSDSEKFQIFGDISVKLADRSAFDSVGRLADSFFLGVKKTEEHSRKLVDLINYIDLRPHRVIIIKLKKDNRKGIASVCIPADLVGTGCSHGVRIALLTSNSNNTTNNNPPNSSSSAQPKQQPESSLPVSTTNKITSETSSGPNYDPKTLYVDHTKGKSHLGTHPSSEHLIPSHYISPSLLKPQRAVVGFPEAAAGLTEEPLKKKSRAVNFDAPQVRNFSHEEPATAVAQQPMSAQDQAAAQYNKLNRRTATRHLSYIYHLRELDNCVKSAVISLAAQHVFQRKAAPLQGLSVLELAMGKGGDFQKWLDVGLTRYVGADIAENSLRDFVDNRLLDLVTPIAERRAFGEHDRAKVQLLVVADLAAHSLSLSLTPSSDVSAGGRTEADLGQLLCFDWERGWHQRPSGRVLTASSSSTATNAGGRGKQETNEEDERQFDVVSCQFAMHYMCRAKANFSFFLQQLSLHLHPVSGVFVATTVDCRVLAQYLRVVLFGSSRDLLRFGLRVDQLPSEGFYASSLEERIRFSVVHRDLAVETVLLTLSFTLHHAKRLLQLYNEENSKDDGFGLEYSFTLFDNSRDTSKTDAENDEEGAGEVAVDAPEWVVPLKPSFLQLLHTHRLSVQRVTNFQRYFADDCARDTAPSDVKKRLKRVRNAIPHEGMSAAEWALARLYLVLVIAPSSSPVGTVRDEKAHWQQEADRLFFSDIDADTYTSPLSSGAAEGRQVPKANAEMARQGEKRPSSPASVVTPSLLTPLSLDANSIAPTTNKGPIRSVLARLFSSKYSSLLQTSPDSSPPVSPRSTSTLLPLPPSDAVLLHSPSSTHRSGQGSGRWLCMPPITAVDLRSWQEVERRFPMNEDVVSPSTVLVEEGGGGGSSSNMDTDDVESRLYVAIYERAVALAGGEDSFNALTEEEQDAVQERAEAEVRKVWGM